MSKKTEVRLGVVGCGAMAHYHMEQFKDVSRLKFAAASDSSPESVKKTVDRYHVKGFADANAMMDSGLVDAILIATPHYFHPVYAKEAFKRNLHVLTEKPVTVTAKAAAEVNKIYSRKRGLIYGAMLQNRTMPKWRKAKELITAGELGALNRMHWIVTNWFRSEAYYKSGTWRATWAGEGGGVLLNQCPHNLDMLYWLVGQPRRVTAHVSLGKHHKIEVEDEVTAYMEFPNGATGVFITSTGEFPGTDHLEIAGDRGRLVITETNTLEFIKTDVSVSEFSRTTDYKFGGPGKSRSLIEVGDANGHKLAQQNFVNAILDGEPLIAPGVEGLYSVELANAMIYSGLTGKPVDLPMNRDAYEKLLNKLAKASGAKK
jgi:predicted dehydrogenase